jgi:hypothetical protein
VLQQFTVGRFLCQQLQEEGEEEDCTVGSDGGRRRRLEEETDADDHQLLLWKAGIRIFLTTISTATHGL